MTLAVTSHGAPDLYNKMVPTFGRYGRLADHGWQELIGFCNGFLDNQSPIPDLSQTQVLVGNRLVENGLLVLPNFDPIGALREKAETEFRTPNSGQDKLIFKGVVVCGSLSDSTDRYLSDQSQQDAYVVQPTVLELGARTFDKGVVRPATLKESLTHFLLQLHRGLVSFEEGRTSGTANLIGLSPYCQFDKKAGRLIIHATAIGAPAMSNCKVFVCKQPD